MPRKQNNIHYLYKTTCLVTGRYYIGMHSTTNLEDGYMGSGKRLRYSIRKHGKENHVKEILEFFGSRELLVEAERNVITPDMLVDNMCMNLKEGGSGGFISIEQQRYRSKCANQALLEKRKKDNEFNSSWLEKKRSGLKNAYATGKLKPNCKAWNKGKVLTDEHKKNIGETNSIKQRGSSNSQYGTCWVNRNQENKKIPKELLDTYLKDGWLKGRYLTEQSKFQIKNLAKLRWKNKNGS